jgi:biotin transport system substrate-specific component
MPLKEKIKSNSLIHFITKVRKSELFWIFTFSVLTFLSAQVIIPVQPVPFTLQTMLVLLSGAFLGSRNGAYSQVLYLVAGIIGLPVYAGYSFGIAKLFGPTGGYLLSFPFAAFLAGYIIEKNKSSIAILISFLIAGFLILLIGSLYLSYFMNGNVRQSLYSGLLIFSVWDIIKIAAAFSIYKAFSKKVSKLP